MDSRRILHLLVIFFLVSCADRGSQDKNSTGNSAVVKADTLPPGSRVIDLGSFYKSHNVSGMMAIYDTRSGEHIFYNPALYHKAVSPASTFNILLALIGLKEGHLENARSTLVRGDIEYTYAYPGDTMTLEEGFTNNRDWFFIRLSSLIGPERMKHWMQIVKYGNGSIQGESDRFWINGELAITPAQQMEFIKNFIWNFLLGFY